MPTESMLDDPCGQFIELAIEQATKTGDDGTANSLSLILGDRYAWLAVQEIV